MSTPVLEVCRQARAAAAVARELNSDAKDAVLLRLAEAIEGAKDRLQAANAIDIAAAREEAFMAGPFFMR